MKEEEGTHLALGPYPPEETREPLEPPQQTLAKLGTHSLDQRYGS